MLGGVVGWNAGVKDIANRVLKKKYIGFYRI